MKQISLYFVLLLLAVTLPSAKNGDLILFDTTTFDFGTVTDTAEPITYEYEFVNVSDNAVAVLSVSTGCGCTRPEYPTEPIAAGKKGRIKISFLPAGQSGEVDRSIKVRYRGAKDSSSKRITLRLRGVVVPTNADKK